MSVQYADIGAVLRFSSEGNVLALMANVLALMGHVLAWKGKRPGYTSLVVRATRYKEVCQARQVVLEWTGSVGLTRGGIPG